MENSWVETSSAVLIWTECDVPVPGLRVRTITSCAGHGQVKHGERCRPAGSPAQRTITQRFHAGHITQRDATHAATLHIRRRRRRRKNHRRPFSLGRKKAAARRTAGNCVGDKMLIGLWLIDCSIAQYTAEPLARRACQSAASPQCPTRHCTLPTRACLHIRT